MRSLLAETCTYPIHSDVRRGGHRALLTERTPMLTTHPLLQLFVAALPESHTCRMYSSWADFKRSFGTALMKASKHWDDLNDYSAGPVSDVFNCLPWCMAPGGRTLLWAIHLFKGSLRSRCLCTKKRTKLVDTSSSGDRRCVVMQVVCAGGPCTLCLTEP